MSASTQQDYSKHAHLPIAVVSVILFLSGIGALIFETLWLRFKRPCLWQLGLGDSVDPVQFHGRPGARECDRRVIENSTMAAASSLCLAGGARRSAWCTIVFGLPVLGELLRPVWQTLWNYQPALLGLRFAVSF
jgi:hypothetical protein